MAPTICIDVRMSSEAGLHGFEFLHAVHAFRLDLGKDKA